MNQIDQSPSLAAATCADIPFRRAESKYSIEQVVDYTEKAKWSRNLMDVCKPQRARDKLH
jgi:hypothetical protein